MISSRPVGIQEIFLTLKNYQKEQLSDRNLILLLQKLEITFRNFQNLIFPLFFLYRKIVQIFCDKNSKENFRIIYFLFISFVTKLIQLQIINSFKLSYLKSKFFSYLCKINGQSTPFLIRFIPLTIGIIVESDMYKIYG